MNLIKLSLLFSVLVSAVCSFRLADDETKPPIESDIDNVETSLNEIDLLLRQMETDPEQSKQFGELNKHVTLIREQLRVILDEYELNKNMDQYLQKFGDWNQNVQQTGDRLKRDLESFHLGH